MGLVLTECEMDLAVFKAYDIRGVYPDQIDEEDA
jgi:hypothetical protein